MAAGHNEFVRFLFYAIAPNDETLDHWETLFETDSLKNEQIYNEIHNKIRNAG